MSIAGRPSHNRLKLRLERFGLEIKREGFPAVIDFPVEVEKSPSLGVFESTSYKQLLGAEELARSGFPCFTPKDRAPAMATEAQGKLPYSF